MKRRIARLGLMLALAGPLGNALGQAPAGGTRFEQRWPFAADGSVRIVNPAGRIRVIGWDTDSRAVSGRGPGGLAAAGTPHAGKSGVTPRGGVGGAGGGRGVKGGTVGAVRGTARFGGVRGGGGCGGVEGRGGGVGRGVPATTVADFDLLSIGGSITNRLTADVAERGALRFSTGPGGAQVIVRSFKGSISLEAK